jgi:esterase/lipase superfamily enzyme
MRDKFCDKCSRNCDEDEGGWNLICHSCHKENTSKIVQLEIENQRLREAIRAHIRYAQNVDEDGFKDSDCDYSDLQIVLEVPAPERKEAKP